MPRRPPVDGDLLPVETLGPPGGEPGGASDAVDEVDLGGRRRWGGAAVVAVLGLIAGGAMVLDRDEPRPPERDAVPPVTSTVPRLTTTVRPGAPAPFFAGFSVLPGITADVTVVALARSGDLYRFDLVNGGGVQRSLRGAIAERPSPRAVIPRAGGVVVVDGVGEAWFVPDEASATAVRLPGGPSVGHTAASDPALLWRWGVPERARRHVELIDARTGAVVASHLAPPLSTPLVDDGTGGLVFAAPAGTYRLDATGSVWRLTRAPVLGVSGDVIVGISCDEVSDCTWQAIDRTSVALRGRGLLEAVGDSSLGAVSPDGRWLALDDLVLVDLDTGAVRQVPTAGITAPGGRAATADALAWSPDGGVLAWVDADGRLNAWSDGVVAVDNSSALPPLAAVALVAG